MISTIEEAGRAAVGKDPHVTNTGTILGEPADAPYAVPHNIVLTTEMDMLFLTHSGPTSDKVTFYSVGASDPTPILVGEATVRFNPFGLAFVP